MATDLPTQIPVNERESLDAFRTYLDLLPPGPWVSDHWNQTVNGPVGPAYAIMDAMGRGLASSTVNIVMRRNGAGDEADEDEEYTGVQRAMSTAGAQESDEEWEPVPSNHPIRELFEYPNDQDSIGDILYKHWFQWALTGSCFEWCPPNGFDEPSRIFNIPTVLTFALPVTPQYPAGAWRVMPQTSLGAYAVIPGNSSAAGAIIPAQEMVVDRNPHPWVAYDGYSKFQAAATQLDVVKQIDLMRSSAAQNGVEPSLVIIAPPGFPTEEAVKLENKINARYSGPYSIRKVMVMAGAKAGTEGMQVMPWSRGPNETGGFETWEQMVGFLSALWGVPRAVSGLVDASSYAQLFAALKQFHTLGLIPFARKIAQVWSKKILWPTWGRNYRAQIDVPAIDDRDSLRADLDLLGKYQAVRVNEIRKKLGFPAIPGSDGEAMVGQAAQKQAMELEEAKSKNIPQAIPGKSGESIDRPENDDGKGSLPNRIAPHMNGVARSTDAHGFEHKGPGTGGGQFTSGGGGNGKTVPIDEKALDTHGKHPFPIDLNPPYKGGPTDEQRRDSPFHEIELDSLTATQSAVGEKKARQLAADPSLGDKDPTGPIVVIRHPNGKLYIDDGHHRAVAAALRNENTVRAKVFDYDPKTEKFSASTNRLSTPHMNGVAKASVNGDGSIQRADTNGQWVTIHGAHIFIEGGRVTKGPKNLVGKNPSEVSPAHVEEARKNSKAPWEMSAQEAKEAGVKYFRTSQGSLYAHANGQSIRVKSKHLGHDKKDVGLKRGSEKTHFISSADATRIGLWQGSSSEGKRIVVKDGYAHLVSKNPTTGQYGRDGAPIKLQDTPEKGLSPLELNDSSSRGGEQIHQTMTGGKVYAGNHPGTPISEFPEHESAHGEMVSAARESGKKVRSSEPPPLPQNPGSGNTFYKSKTPAQVHRSASSGEDDGSIQRADSGRWITIGGSKGEGGKRSGGSPVFVKDGRIVKGAPSLHGKKIDALKEADDTPQAKSKAAQSRKDNASSRDYDAAVWRKKARKAGHDPKALDQLAGEIKAHHDAFASERKDVLQHAREHSKRNNFADLRSLNVTSGKGRHDANSIKGFDQTAEATHAAYPHHFHPETGEHGSHEDQLFEMLTGGEPEPMEHGHAYEQAFETLESAKHESGHKATDDWVPWDDDEIPRASRNGVKRSTDSSGHEHAPSGPGGGQFVSGGGSGKGNESEAKPSPKSKRQPTAAFSEDARSLLDSIENGDIDGDEALGIIDKHLDEFQEKFANRIEAWGEGEMAVLVGEFTEALINHPDADAAFQDFNSEQDDLVDEMNKESDAVREAVAEFAADEDADTDEIEAALDRFDELKAEAKDRLVKIVGDYRKALNEVSSDLSADADSFADDLNSTDYEGKLDEAKQQADDKNAELEDEGNPFRLTYDAESDEWSTYIPTEGDDTVSRAMFAKRFHENSVARAAGRKHVQK